MPVVSSSAHDVVSHTSVAALLLAATTHLARLGLCHPSTADILEATGASRSRAYELKDRLHARLDSLTASAGRPVGTPPPPAPQDLATVVLRHVFEHPGCVRRGGQQHSYSDGFTHLVMELMARHPDVSIEALAQTIVVPAGTLKDWRRRAAAAGATPEPASNAPPECSASPSNLPPLDAPAPDAPAPDAPAPDAPAPDAPAPGAPVPERKTSDDPTVKEVPQPHGKMANPPDAERQPTEEDAPNDAHDGSSAQRSSQQGLHIETVLAEWERWDGAFCPFCDHVRKHCAIPFGYTLIAGILEGTGGRIPRRRKGRSPDEFALRRAFETFFPGAQWVGDGTQVVVEVDGEPFAFNVELNVDAYSAAFVGAHVSPSEDSDAVIAAFRDACHATGERPIALLLDNKPSNHTDNVDQVLQSTLRLRATPFRPQNKAHVEGAFGLLKPTLDGLTLTGTSPAELAASFLRALVITAGRAINHRPRKDRGGRSRVDLLNETPSPEDVKRAKQILEERLRRQALARETRAARQDPIVRATLADAYKRLGLDDPDGHLLTATARYPLDAVLDGIAIFESRHNANKLPHGVDARYLLGIIRNIDEENETWELAMALWDERVRAGDRIALRLGDDRQRIAADARTPQDHILAYTELALGDPRRLQTFFWLTAVADVIRDAPQAEHHRLFRIAARRIAAAHTVPRDRRATAQRFLAAKLQPLR